MEAKAVWFQVVLATIALGPYHSWAASSGADAKAAADPGIQLFHSGPDPLDYNSPLITELRQTYNKPLSDKQAFMNSRDVAEFMGLHKVGTLHMPVPLNIVFVGFQGDGNMHINISTAELQEWFNHLDHVLPHSRIELAELGCSEDGYCSGLAHGHYVPQPLPSSVHLNFSCHLVVVQAQAVIDTFEKAIETFSRPVDPQIETGAQQVDANRMEAFVDSFLQYLGLDDTPSMVVINPKWSVAEPVYGYRTGFSQAEMDYMVGKLQGPRVMQLLSSIPFGSEPQVPTFFDKSWAARSKSNYGYGSKFNVREAKWDSTQWVDKLRAYLQQEADFKRKLMQQLQQAGAAPDRRGGELGLAAMVQAARVQRRHDRVLASILQEELKDWRQSDWKQEQNIHSRFRTMHAAEDCLVSTWVSRSRWLLLDLTAGGADWGPALGGDGVVTKHALPRVDDYFGVVAEMAKSSGERRKSLDERELALHAELSQVKSERLAHVANRQHQAYMHKRAEKERHAQAPGAAPVAHDAEEEEAWARHYTQVLRQAELDVLEDFAIKHCKGRDPPPVTCREAQAKALEIRKALSKIDASRGLLYDLDRSVHNWDIFGAPLDVEKEMPELADEAVRRRDLFMAELSSLLSRGMRHVVAPPSAAWHHTGVRQDAATPFAKMVHFDIYLITEDHLADTLRSDPKGPTFDLQAFKDGMQQVMLANQYPQFSVHRLNLLDDPLLSTAFAAALRTAHLEVPSMEDMVEDTERVYVDSRELAHHLRQQFAHARSPKPSKAGQSHLAHEEGAGYEGGEEEEEPSSQEMHSSVNVPVFIFQLQRDSAVLIDLHYNARALEDMVVVLVNDARDDEHPTGMMCGGALVGRPLSPLRDALAATLTYLAGLLPPHLGYNPGKRQVTHDWLWSVGAHPYSFTCTGTRFSSLQRDAMARTYLLDAMDASVMHINEGVALLRGLRPSHHGFGVINHKKMLPQVRLAQAKYGEVVDTWRNMLLLAYDRNWETATENIMPLHERSLKFREVAREIVAAYNAVKCIGATKDDTERHVPHMLMGSGAVAFLALLWGAWPRLVKLRGGNKKRH